MVIITVPVAFNHSPTARKPPYSRVVAALFFLELLRFNGIPMAASAPTDSKAQPATPAVQEPSHTEEVAPTASGDESRKAGLLAFTWTDGLKIDGRKELEERGVKFNFYLNNQYQAVVKGGLDTNGGRNSASLDAFVTMDFDRLGWIENADALLHLQSNWGAGVNARTGSLLDVNDDADGDLGLHVAQLWYRQRFPQQRFSVTVGFLDFQTIVDRNAFANSEDKQFWNQALDNNPLVSLGIGLGAWAEIRPTDWWTMNLGAVDAQSVLYKPGFSTAFHGEASFLGYFENVFTLTIPSSRGALKGNYRAGVVYDPRPRSVFVDSDRPARQENENYGFFVSVDQKLFLEKEKSEEGLGVFGRFGYQDPDTYRMNRFWSAGLSYTGLIPRRDADVLGFGFAMQQPSDVYQSRVDPDFEEESVYEFYYAIQLNNWLVVTPDLQYIENPGGTDDGKPAIVAGVRVRASF